MYEHLDNQSTEFINHRHGTDIIVVEVSSYYLEKHDLYGLTIKFNFDDIAVNFYCRADYRPGYIVSDIIKNIEEHRENWNEHFYYKNNNIYQDGNIINY